MLFLSPAMFLHCPFGRIAYAQWKTTLKPGLEEPMACETNLSIICQNMSSTSFWHDWNKSKMNWQIWTVVINVQLAVFLMGQLIKNRLLAAGFRSHPITAPPCPNLCHRPLLLHPPLQTCPPCLIWHLCLGVLWWNSARLLSLRRCSLLAAVHFAAM